MTRSLPVVAFDNDRLLTLCEPAGNTASPSLIPQAPEDQVRRRDSRHIGRLIVAAWPGRDKYYRLTARSRWSVITDGYQRPPYPTRHASRQMNTTESAAAVSGDPAAAAIMIQTKMTGSSLRRGRGTDGTICVAGTGRGSRCGRSAPSTGSTGRSPVSSRRSAQVFEA